MVAGGQEVTGEDPYSPRNLLNSVLKELVGKFLRVFHCILQRGCHGLMVSIKHYFVLRNLFPNRRGVQ